MRGARDRTRRSRVLVSLIACFALVVTLGLAFAMLWPERRASDPGVRGVRHATARAEATPAVRREKRPTLDPGLYEGEIALAYQVARDIPDVLDQLTCYCACATYGHVSLLSCYTDGHAAT